MIAGTTAAAGVLPQGMDQLKLLCSSAPTKRLSRVIHRLVVPPEVFQHLCRAALQTDPLAALGDPAAALDTLQDRREVAIAMNQGWRTRSQPRLRADPLDLNSSRSANITSLGFGER